MGSRTVTHKVDRRLETRRLRSSENVLDFIFISFGLLCIIQAVLNVSLRLSQSRESTNLSCISTPSYNITQAKALLDCEQRNNQQCKGFQERLNTLSRETDLLRNQITNLENTVRNLENEKMNLENEKKNLRKKLKELSTSSQPCPDGWMVIQCRCYFLSSEMRSWQEGRSSCQAVGADLVVTQTKEEQRELVRYMARFPDLQFWIGLSNTTGTFQWVDGSIETFGARPGKRDCVKITVHSYTSYSSADVPCGQRLRWVCEKDPR
ncbi:CD209 antigen-like protein E isoform X2 [Antennarius striatus]|uniref:CD209 antigen-like protein E isoform X2 n=1 Tax=Antennarius striatus TaxID=241820 RepID=UPI0035B46698